MICTVSTVKDSLPNVTNFVRRNLAAGVDHMFVFLEGGDREVFRFLDEQPHVTAVDALEMHRAKPQPANLNARQTVNANRINYLLAGVDSARWLFHIDGDECLDIDKEQLLALGPDVEYVRLAPKESVSTSEPGDTVYFKRLLADDELALLTVLGLLDSSSNRQYFQGHVSGKVGVRPSMRYGLHQHEASGLQGEEMPEEFRAVWLNLLHYESFTPEEFVRKWSVHVAAGPQTKFRKEKEVVRGAITSVLNNDHLDEQQKRQYILDIYRRRVEDDVPTLLQLGLLENVDPLQRGHNPDSLSARDRSVITEVLPQLLEAEPGYFRPRQIEHDPSELMKAIGYSVSIASPTDTAPGSSTSA